MISGVKAISEAAATFSGKYGQSTAVAIFEDVFVPWEANGLDLDQAPYLREAMVELIKIVEGFYASEWPLRCTQRRTLKAPGPR